MTRIAFISDLQIGSGESYGTPTKPRLDDQAETLRAFTERIVELEVDEVVIAGDLFERRRPSIAELVVANDWLRSLPTGVYLMAGNHDVIAPWPAPSTVDLFGGFSRPTLSPLGDVVLAFMPWAHPGPLRAAREGATALEQAAAMLEIAQGLRIQCRAMYPDAEPVLVTHYALTGFSTPTGVATGELVGEPVLDSYGLAAQGWSYVFAGHIHRADEMTIDGATVLVSIGSPWIQDFSEAEERHGFWLLDSEGDLERYDLPGRRFVTISGAVAEESDVALLSADEDVRDAVVRVRLLCSEDVAGRISLAALKRDLYELGAHKVFAIQLDVERNARARVEGMSEETEPLESLRAWLTATSGAGNVPTERLLHLTESLLEEVSR